MIKSAENYPLSVLFNQDASLVYSIPRYQREYTWRKEHWENLYDDLLENHQGYFLGSIICINQAKDAIGVQELEVVDGQQRLTTISLLFAAIYDALKDNGDDQDRERTLVERVNLKWRLVLKTADEQVRVIPQIQNNNLRDYKAVLAEVGILGFHETVPYAGNRRIFRCFQYFQKRIKDMCGDEHNRPKDIHAFLQKVLQASLVKIEVASHSDAYTLFESLNNRGVPLTPVDLIKNKLLAKLDSTSESKKVDSYFERWNQLLRYLGDDYGTQERFFRQYYNAFRSELKGVAQASLATRSNLIQIYEKLIENNAGECMNKICDAGRLYGLLVFSNDDDARFKILDKPLKDLERIQGAPSYLLILYLLSRMATLELEIKHISEVVVLLVSFFVRRNLTDKPPTRDLTPFFVEIIDKVAGLKGIDAVNLLRRHLVDVSASDEDFRSKLGGQIYEENSGVARFLLCAIAENWMTKETRVDLWGVENKHFVWTIEHVFPQGSNIPLSWIEMIADGDEQKAKEIQHSHVHMLGNLTLSGFNSNLGNKSFEEKRDRTDQKGRQVGYKNGFKLNQDLANAERWSVEQIEDRTQTLVDLATSMFRINGSA